MTAWKIMTNSITVNRSQTLDADGSKIASNMKCRNAIGIMYLLNEINKTNSRILFSKKRQHSTKRWPEQCSLSNPRKCVQWDGPRKDLAIYTWINSSFDLKFDTITFFPSPKRVNEIWSLPLHNSWAFAGKLLSKPSLSICIRSKSGCKGPSILDLAWLTIFRTLLVPSPANRQNWENRDVRRFISLVVGLFENKITKKCFWKRAAAWIDIGFAAGWL